VYREKSYSAANGLVITLVLIAAIIGGMILAVLEFRAGNEPIGLIDIGVVT
jgi:hypothetical protein